LRGEEGSHIGVVKGLGTWPKTAGIKEGKVIPQNKFEMLSSRVMRYGVELRRQEMEGKGW